MDIFTHVDKVADAVVSIGGAAAIIGALVAGTKWGRKAHLQTVVQAADTAVQAAEQWRKRCADVGQVVEPLSAKQYALEALRQMVTVNAHVADHAIEAAVSRLPKSNLTAPARDAMGRFVVR